MLWHQDYPTADDQTLINFIDKLIAGASLFTGTRLRSGIVYHLASFESL